MPIKVKWSSLHGTSYCAYVTLCVSRISRVILSACQGRMKFDGWRENNNIVTSCSQDLSAYSNLLRKESADYCLLGNIQTGSGAIRPLGNRSSFLAGKAFGAWRWPYTHLNLFHKARMPLTKVLQWIESDVKSQDSYENMFFCHNLFIQ
jgi:hypothetical protein